MILLCAHFGRIFLANIRRVMILLLSTSIQITPLIVSTVVLFLAVIVIALLCDDKKTTFNTKSLAFAGISVALCFGLSFIKIFRMPQGGSVTLASLLPLLLYSYFFGTKKGAIAGLAYGLLSSVIDPHIVHPAQYLLDYPIAFIAVGLAGMLKKVNRLEKYPWVQFALGSIVAGALRFFSHVLSGVFAFSTYATSDVWIYSLIYNSYVFIDIGIAVAVGIICLLSNSLKNLLNQKK